MNYKNLLAAAKTVAVVGCSPNPARTSHRIARYLDEAGYDVIPVNPNSDVILQKKSYPSLSEIPEKIEVDIVNIFRRPKYTADIVREAIARGGKPVIWTQLGVSSPEARQLAEENDLQYVHNRCIMVEHIR